MSKTRARPSTRSLSAPYRIAQGRTFRLSSIDPADAGPRGLRAHAKTTLKRGIKALSEAQERMYAQDRWALLPIFQAMDAAGRDGTIKHVMSGVNPQGVQEPDHALNSLDLACPGIGTEKRTELDAARAALLSEPETSDKRRRTKGS